MWRTARFREHNLGHPEEIRTATMTKAQSPPPSDADAPCRASTACIGSVNREAVPDRREGPPCALSDAYVLSSAEKFRLCLVLDALPANVAVLDREGRILSVNEGWRRFARENGGNQLIAEGINVDYLAACRQAQHLGDASAGLAAEGIEAVLAGRQRQFSLEYPCDSPQQSRWFSMKVTAFGEMACEGAVVLHFDITAQRQVELETSRQRDLLARESRLHGISELASSITHELTQPLTAMSYYCDALQTTLAPHSHPLTDDLVARLRNQLGRAMEVVTHLRSFMRRLHPELAAVSVEALMHQVSGLVETYARDHKCRMTYALPHDLPAVSGDATQLQQVLITLLHNAIEASVSVPGQVPLVEVSAARLGNWVRISVLDNGPGMQGAPPDNIFKHIQVDNSGRPGLGLSISLSIIKAHGGELWLDTGCPHGSCVHFTLAVAGDPHEA